MTDTTNENEQDSDSPTAPKIIVDSDWKEQVEKERAAAAAESSEERVQGSAEEGQNSEEEDSGNETAANDPSTLGEAVQSTATVQSTAAERPTLPPPSFEILISMLFTQAISALGQIPNPVDGETSVDKAMAKHSIDMIEMLEAKTKGNVSDDESKMLREALHALRMAYVGVRG